MAAIRSVASAVLLKHSVIRPLLCIGSVNNVIYRVSLNHADSFYVHSFHTTSRRRDVFNVQDADDFKENVLKNALPVIVDFHATWCGPCKLLAPRLESVMSAHHGKIHLAKVDVDENTELAMEYDVTAVPAVIAFKGGKISDRFIGLQDEDQLKSFVNKLIGPK